jgi:hypothetical protein
MIKNRPAFVPVIAISIIAITFIAWQLIGLRFTNHDDIFFHLYSQVFSSNYVGFAENTAFKQARLQAFINMPLILWANSLQGSAWFDVANISTFVFLYSAIIFYFAILIGKRDAFLLASITALTFPLHYYFTFPQGYPVMAAWGLAFAFFSAGMLGSYLKKPDKKTFLLSLVLFTCSLWGPEYNLVLHPILLLITYFAINKTAWNYKNVAYLVWPYVIAWIVSLGAYFIFSVMSRSVGGDEVGRVSMGFNFLAWIKTFLVLQEKAFLPVSLFRGIGLTTASLQGAPEIPAVLSYSSLWHSYYDTFSTAVIFIVFLLVFALVLRLQKFTDRTLAIASIALATLVIVPALVVAGSVHYQDIVLKGWLQGHLISFYSHLGCSGLLFLILVFLINKTPSVMRSIVIIGTCTVLAGYSTITLFYNNANRQAMMANQQKWEAMRVLVSYIQNEQPELIGKNFYAPAFWTSTGVSSIPGDSPFNGVNYWTLYTEHVLGQKLSLFNEDKKFTGEVVEVNYFSTPRGVPVIVLGEKKTHTTVAVASEPISGNFIDQRNGTLIKAVELKDWHCSVYCSTIFDKNSAVPSLDVSFKSSDSGPKQLISQFFTPRNSGYGNPFVTSDSMQMLKVENWGPQETTVGTIPNVQPDGGAGVWIKLDNQLSFGRLQVTIDGQPAQQTNVSPGLITTSLPPTIFNKPGKKRILVVNVNNGESVAVGEFLVINK